MSADTADLLAESIQKLIPIIGERIAVDYQGGNDGPSPQRELFDELVGIYTEVNAKRLMSLDPAQEPWEEVADASAFLDGEGQVSPPQDSKPSWRFKTGTNVEGLKQRRPLRPPDDLSAADASFVLPLEEDRALLAARTATSTTSPQSLAISPLTNAAMDRSGALRSNRISLTALEESYGSFASASDHTYQTHGANNNNNNVVRQPRIMNSSERYDKGRGGGDETPADGVEFCVSAMPSRQFSAVSLPSEGGHEELLNTRRGTSTSMHRLVQEGARINCMRQYRSQSRWLALRTFSPSELTTTPNMTRHSRKSALTANPSGTTESLPLCVRSTPMYQKPKGFMAKRAALQLQFFACQGCGRDIGIKWLTLRRGGLPSLDRARFCYETGYYYCAGCHRGREECLPIVAHLLSSWDATPRPVCTAVYSFWQPQRAVPLLCVGTLAPQLYDRVPLLKGAHLLRQQISAMREVGVRCREFRRLCYGNDLEEPDNADTKSSDVEESTHIPDGWRYYMEDTELWSLNDLAEIHTACPLPVLMTDEASAGWEEESLASALSRCRSSPPYRSSSTTTSSSNADSAASNRIPVLDRLRTIRNGFNLHVSACAVCMRRAMDVCRLCCPSDAADTFTKVWLADECAAEEDEGEESEQHGAEDDLTAGASDATTTPITSCEEGRGSFLLRIPLAARSALVMSYDVLHVRRCALCSTLTHIKCWETVGVVGRGCTEMPCRGCQLLHLGISVSEPGANALQQ